MKKNELINRKLKLIPISEINITYDKDKTIGWDFTVIDNYTFCTYDGIFVQDTQSIHIPLTKESSDEIKEKILLSKNLISPANGDILTIPSQDIILGFYLLSTKYIDHKELNKNIEYKNKNIPYAFKIINECFPDDYPLIIGKIDKKILLNILNDIKENYSMEILKESLDKVKQIGFKFCTQFAPTLTLENMIVHNKEEIKNNIYSKENIFDQITELSGESVQNMLKNELEGAYFVDSGARGNWNQMKQIVLSRGYMSTFKGDILKDPVKNGLIDGLDPYEFFLSSYGCRRAGLDIALNVGASGYMSRKLLFTCINLELDTECKDCGTTDGLLIKIDSHEKLLNLKGKYLLDNDQIIIGNEIELIGQEIKVRSPIYCKNEKICLKCYGDFYKYLNTTKIGIIAPMSLGERTSQLTLSVFHTSGAAQVRNRDEFKEDNMKQDDIVSDMSKLSKLLHKFDETTTASNLIESLYKIFSTTGKINHVHLECVVSQMMWVNNTKWRLHNNRNSILPQFKSIQSVPSFESWILGMGFSKPKYHIIKGLLTNTKYSGIYDKIILGENLDSK